MSDRRGPNKHGDFRRFVETACMSCVIEVAGFDWSEPGNPRRDGEVWCALISDHDFRPNWRLRVKNAWRMLSGQSATSFEMFSPEEVDEFIAAVRDCREAIFGPVVEQDCRHLRAKLLFEGGDKVRPKLWCPDCTLCWSVDRYERADPQEDRP